MGGIASKNRNFTLHSCDPYVK